MSLKPVVVGVAEKLASGAPLHFRREFCPWLGIGPVYGYELIKRGQLRVTKIGKTNFVMPRDAYACLELVAGHDTSAVVTRGAA